MKSKSSAPLILYIKSDYLCRLFCTEGWVTLQPNLYNSTKKIWIHLVGLYKSSKTREKSKFPPPNCTNFGRKIYRLHMLLYWIKSNFLSLNPQSSSKGIRCFQTCETLSFLWKSEFPKKRSVCVILNFQAFTRKWPQQNRFNFLYDNQALNTKKDF